MNYKAIFRVVSYALLLEAICMVPGMLLCLLDGEPRVALAYLAAIARNAARQKLRQFHPAEALPEDRELVDDTPLPEQQAETAEQAAALRHAINAMAPEDRALFIRFYYLEQTVEEIAAVTGQNASTLRVRLHRGRKRLKQLLLERGVCCD